MNFSETQTSKKKNKEDGRQLSALTGQSDHFFVALRPPGFLHRPHFLKEGEMRRLVYKRVMSVTCWECVMNQHMKPSLGSDSRSLQTNHMSFK